MGYFTITLPNNIEGQVRWGKVFKKHMSPLSLLMPWRKLHTESKTGYIIKLKSAFVNETEYRLYQAKDGHWSQDVEGKVEVQEPITLAIRKAIEDHQGQYR